MSTSNNRKILEAGVARTYGTVFPDNAFDPVTFGIIIDGIIRILGFCFENLPSSQTMESRERQIREKMRAGKGFARRQAMKVVSDAHPEMRRRELKRLRDQMVMDWQVAPDEEYDAMFAEARAQMGA